MGSASVAGSSAGMERINAAVQACQEGDLSEFTQLYDTFIQKIFQYIYYKTTHKETAEDLTSVTFTKALERIGSFDASKGSFSSWLYTIARNSVIDHYRVQKPGVNIEDVWGLAGSEDIERDAEARQQLREVEQYLKQLKPQQRDIVILRVWDQLSYAEIAEITGLSEANCKMTYSRTIRRLRDDLGTNALSVIALIATTVWLTN